MGESGPEDVGRRLRETQDRAQRIPIQDDIGIQNGLKVIGRMVWG